MRGVVNVLRYKSAKKREEKKKEISIKVRQRGEQLMVGTGEYTNILRRRLVDYAKLTIWQCVKPPVSSKISCDYYASFLRCIYFRYYLHAERLHLLICNIYIRQQKS